MRLSQIASSYSFLYKKSGGGGSGEEARVSGEVPRRLLATNGEDSPEPYYVSYDGNFYDKHFNLSSPIQAMELKNSELLKGRPQSADYTTYKAYESDLLFWKEQVTSLLKSNNVKLPHLLGLHLFRPATAQEYTGKSSNEIQQGESQDQEVHTKEKDPWESQLVLEEPNPENYNTYDEYKTALSRWASICSRIPSLPPHASQVSSEHLLERCTNVMQSSLPKEMGRSEWSLPAPDIPLEDDSQKSLNDIHKERVEEAYPLTGAHETSKSLHRIDILPIWHPQRNFFKWLVLLISCLFSVGSYFAYDTIGVVEGDIEKYFNITSDQFGLLYSVYTFPNIVLPFFGGILLDRIGLPIGTTTTTFLVMIGALIVALAPVFGHSFFMMLVGRFLFGVGAESSYVAQNTICCAWFKDGKILAFAMGISVSAGRLGAFATFATNSYIVAHFGTYTAALWAGVVFSTLCFVAGVTYMLLHYYAQWMIKGTKAQLHTAESNPPIRLRDLFGYPPVFYIATAVCTIYYAVVFPFQSTAVAMLVRTKGMDPDTAGLYVSVIPATSLFLSPVFGIIVDKVGRKLYFVITGIIIMIPAFLLLMESWWPPLISFVIIGVCFAMVPAAIWPCLPVLVEDRQIGTAFGLMSSFINAGLTFVYWAQGKFLSDDGRLEAYLFSGLAGVGFVLTCMWLMIDATTMKSICNRPPLKISGIAGQ